MKTKAKVSLRPIPPPELGQFIGNYPVCVMPAPEMPKWVLDTFLNPDSRLYNADHFHLYDALQENNIGFLFSSGGYFKAGRMVIGLTEELNFRAGYWSKLRQTQQFQEWFGLTIPDWIITLDADYCRMCDDVSFFALVEHELYHIAQEYAGEMPQFKKESGYPKLCMRAHDVEEFIGVVRRYGMTPDVKALVDAANKRPEISRTDIAHACGTCLKLVA